jgi:hypothetical protein
MRLILVSLVACSGSPRQFVDPRPVPTAEQRVAFGVIGIAVANAASPRTQDAPDSVSNLKKAGITVGSGVAGAGIGALMGLGRGPMAFFCVPAGAAAGGFAGTLGGAVGSIPYRTAEQVSNADTTLRNALSSIDVQNPLVESLLARAPEMRELDLRRTIYSRENNWLELGDVADGVDTRLLVEIPKIALVTVNESVDWIPKVRLEIVVEGRIFEDHLERPRFERRWHFFSDVHNYFERAAEQGALVHTDVQRAIAELSDRIVADFF